MTDFVGFGKIQNHTSKRALAAAHQLQEDHPDLTWIATEKIDGANFSLRVDTETGAVTCASRKRMLKPGDKFHGWEALVYGRGADDVEGELEGKAQAVAAEIASWYPHCDSVSGSLIDEVVIFGELCGGSFPGVDVKHKPVQRGIKYHPERIFVAFDVMVRIGLQCVIMNPVCVRPVLAREGFQIAACVGTGHSAEALLKLTAEIASRVSFDAGLGSLDNNLAEGFVVKPCISQMMESRVAIKKKREGFREVKLSKRPGPINGLEAALIGIMRDSINLNRFNAVRSKELEDCHPGKLCALLIDDAMDDLGAHWTDDVSNKGKRRVKKLLRGETRAMVDAWIEDFLGTS